MSVGPSVFSELERMWKEAAISWFQVLFCIRLRGWEKMSRTFDIRMKLGWQPKVWAVQRLKGNAPAAGGHRTASRRAPRAEDFLAWPQHGKSVAMIYCDKGKGVLRVKSIVRLPTDWIICQWRKCRTGKVQMAGGMCLWYCGTSGEHDLTLSRLSWTRNVFKYKVRTAQ